MAARPKAGGLGRGLGALFGEYNINELEENAKKQEKTKQ